MSGQTTTTSSAAVCATETANKPPSLFQNGNLVFQAHHTSPQVGWIVAALFTLAAMVTSFWLVNKHLSWYTNKREQRHIVRILFMVPIYAVISLASYIFWNNSTPLLLIRDCYESTVLTAFFYLLLNYLSPNIEDQQAIFLKVGLSRAADAAAIARGEEVKKWVFPLGFIKAKPADGLYFLQMMKWGVLQYCVMRPLTTLAAVLLNYLGWYCESSWSPKWGHIYISALVSISVSVAMYCLLQLYVTIAVYLAPQQPLLKLFSIKAVVFLTFWQSIFLSALSTFGVVKNTTYMTAADINIGIGALLETFEMMVFGFLHVKAFSYRPYKPYHDKRSNAPLPIRTARLPALANAFDFRETFREIWAGWVYILDRVRGREPETDFGARRTLHYESAFGRPRQSNLPGGDASAEEKAFIAEPAAPGLGDIYSRREDFPWLALPNYERREKSEGLEMAIDRELARRGYDSNAPGRGHIAPPREEAQGHKGQRSWWRSVYSRVSQSAPDEDEHRLTSQPSRRKKVKSSSRVETPADRRPLFDANYDFDDPPPEPFLPSRAQQTADTLGPLSNFTAHRSSHQRASPALARSDSLLGRVFPPSNETHGTESLPPPSSSFHGAVPQSRMTPRGRVVVTIPPILGNAVPPATGPTSWSPPPQWSLAPMQAIQPPAPSRPSSGGLRRSSAQIYSADSARRGRRQSADVSPYGSPSPTSPSPPPSSSGYATNMPGPSQSHTPHS
ncbi:unnamed protein product, partial [Mycena citricolor]